MFYRRFTKRMLDFILALIGLFILLPLFMLILVLLIFVNKGGIIFTQERPGKNGKIFRVIKFKSMNSSKDSNGNLLPDAQRITVVGKFIRSLSIDELPQLINVLKGDMSLVGPRPLLVSYLPLYNDFQKRRHEVRPGITGWTQVNGRNSLTWDEKFKLDIWYVDNCSFLLDLKILWLTVLKVLKRDGINASDATTMKPFTGNRNS